VSRNQHISANPGFDPDDSPVDPSTEPSLADLIERRLSPRDLLRDHQRRRRRDR
jgi:hypothetical protein